VLLPSFEYERPESVGEAVELLAATRNARVLAGGQTLLNALKLRVVHPDVLVDINRIEALHAIEKTEDGWLSVGSAVVYDELTHNALVRELHPVTASMTAKIVDRQVRARGTIGGNVCLADPTSNFPPLLVALGAELRIRSRDGSRDVAADEFFVAPYMTAVRPGELLEAILLPILEADEGVGYESLQVGTDSWALARACARVGCNGTICSARVAIGCGPVPARQAAFEAALIGLEPTAEAITSVAHLAGEAFDPPADVHASAEYRAEMGRLMARRAVLSATRKEA
jgi:carbon-monoxide dehydrogenase medium subunit